jgi:hypothetical protein
MSRSLLVRMRYVSDGYCTDNQNTHFMFKNFLFNLAVYEICAKML